MVHGHDSPVIIRGAAGNRGELVPRRLLQLQAAPVRPIFTNGSGRLELALGIASRPRSRVAPIQPCDWVCGILYPAVVVFPEGDKGGQRCSIRPPCYDGTLNCSTPHRLAT